MTYQTFLEDVSRLRNDKTGEDRVGQQQQQQLRIHFYGRFGAEYMPV